MQYIIFTLFLFYIMSLFDSEISKSIWNGKIPIKISLDPTETDVYGIEKTWDPIYVKKVFSFCLIASSSVLKLHLLQLEVPRCSYLPLITKQIQQTLTSLGMKVSEEAFASVWYQDSNRQPLKWQGRLRFFFVAIALTFVRKALPHRIII